MVKLIVQLKRRHPSWGPKKIRRLLEADHGVADPPHVNTVGSILRRRGLVSRRRRPPRVVRPAWEGLTDAKRPNHVWAVDFKGWFTLGDGRRCDPLTVSDLFSRYVLLCKAMPNQQLRPAMKAFVGQNGVCT